MTGIFDPAIFDQKIFDIGVIEEPPVVPPIFVGGGGQRYYPKSKTKTIQVSAEQPIHGTELRRIWQERQFSGRVTQQVSASESHLLGRLTQQIAFEQRLKGRIIQAIASEKQFNMISVEPISDRIIRDMLLMEALDT